MNELELTVDKIVGLSNGKVVIMVAVKMFLKSMDLSRKHILDLLETRWGKLDEKYA